MFQKSYSCSPSALSAKSAVAPLLLFCVSCASLRPQFTPRRSPEHCPRIEHTRLQIRDEKTARLYRSALLAVGKLGRNGANDPASNDVKPYRQVVSHRFSAGRMRPFSTSWHRNCFLSVRHRGEDTIFFSMPARRFSAWLKAARHQGRRPVPRPMEMHLLLCKGRGFFQDGRVKGLLLGKASNSQ